MNAPLIPKPRKKHVCEVERAIRQQYAKLIKGHKKDTVRAAERLRRMVDKILLEAHRKRAEREFFAPKVKLLEKHPCWQTGITLPNRKDRVITW